MKLDNITLSVIQAGLQQVCDEMDLSFSRSAFSPVISEANDRSNGIYSAIDGTLISQGLNKEDMKNVERVQHRATKIVKPIKELHYEERLRRHNLPSLVYRRRRGDMIFAYKIFSKKVDLDPSEFFLMAPTRSRGHHYRVVRKKATKQCRINSFSNRIVNDWNSLPEEVVSVKTVDNFKSKLDGFWKDETFKTPF